MTFKFLIPVAAVAVLSLASCNNDKFNDAAVRTQRITINTNISRIKAGLNSDRESFVWTGGDKFTLFNNVNSTTSVVDPSEPAISVEVPEGTSTVYGFSPASDSFTSGPGSVQIKLSSCLTVQKPGSLDELFYPFAARAEVSNSTATLSFKPLLSAIALNIYRSQDYDSAEKITKVTVYPIDNEGLSGNVTLDLNGELAITKGSSSIEPVMISIPNGCPVCNGKPTNGRTYKDQIYVLLPRQSYKGLKFEVKTNKAEYVATSSFTFACPTYDFLVTGFDLSTKNVMVDYENSISSFDVVDTDNILSGIDDPLLLDIGAQSEDVIPDFSRVGYKYGDAEPPVLPVKKTVTVEDVWNNTVAGGGEYPDSTAYIQAMVDEVAKSGGGAIFFKNGRYQISRTIFLDHDNTVIRGESTDGTVFYGAGTCGWDMFFIGASVSGQAGTYNFEWNGRTVKMNNFKAAYYGIDLGDYTYYYSSPVTRSRTLGASTPIIEDYVPLGRLYVEVQNPGLFNVGDDICLYRPKNNDWICDIGMDKIAPNGYTRTVEKGMPVTQWTERSNIARYYARKVTAILGNRIYLDAPVAQSMDRNYGGGRVYQVTDNPRVQGCGIETLTCESAFDPSKTTKNTPTGCSQVTSYIDEDHVWVAISIKSAQHCWVRNVDDLHVGQGLVGFSAGAKNITVDNCHSHEPASYISGNRRYAFLISSGAELILVKNCTTDLDRHSFSMSVADGPNVFYNCEGTRMFDGPEPHQTWCTAGLFDNLTCTNTHLYLRDRGNSGNGHGWAGANFVIWNSHLRTIECSEPWSRQNTPEIETMPNGYKFHSDHPSGHNWCIGSVGKKLKNSANYNSPYFAKDPPVEDYYKDVLGFEHRPDGTWYPERDFNTQGSDADRIDLNNVPAALAEKSWWPKFSGKVTFSHPESLYMSQLEDRHARGIFLNNL